MTSPLISCLMPTYGRVPAASELVDEAVGSFLAQNWSNCELLIVNDCPEQTLVFDHPRVRVINCKERFPSLGEKLNFIIQQAQGSLLCRWDDDDVCFPWRLTLSHNRLQQMGTETWQSRDYWIIYGGVLSYNPGASPAPAKAIWTRNAVEKAGWHQPISSGEDVSLEDQMLAAGIAVPRETLGMEKCYYLYRWTHNSFHVSALGESGYDRIGALDKTPGVYHIEPKDIRYHVEAARKLIPAEP